MALLARTIVALRWPIVVAWVAAAVAATHFVPTIAGAQQGALGGLVAQDAPPARSRCSPSSRCAPFRNWRSR
jgi:uncharacterized membrane protein YdfJ with MMPL/SSD domain